MSFGLSREIYGRTAWAVDGETFSAYLNIIKDFRNGVSQISGTEKYNSVFVLDLLSGTKVISEKWHATTSEARESEELIYLIHLDGPITRSGGSSSYGTKDLSDKINYFESLPNVIGGIIVSDSGGGSTNAVGIMDTAIRNRKKPIVSLIEEGAIACSACYGIISGSDFIMSDGVENRLGSLGTMADFEAIPHKNVDLNGVKTIRVYATKSTAKNNWYEEAANNDNFVPLISEILDPSNEAFLNRIKSNRPQILESQLDGSVYNSGDVIGTLIDGIGTMSDAIEKVKELSGYKKKTIGSNNLNNKEKMDIETLKSEHPETYNSILAEGISSEQERVDSWNAWKEVDSEAVEAGIASKKAITSTDQNKFMAKSAVNAKKEALKRDSPGNIEIEESGSKEQTEEDLFYNQVKKGL